MLVTNSKYVDFKLMSAASAKRRKGKATNNAEVQPNWPNSHMFPSRIERNIRPNFGVCQTLAHL